MSRAKDILNAIRVGLRQGVIKSPDIEFLDSDGPRRVTMLQLVDEAIAELSGSGAPGATDAERAAWLADKIAGNGYCAEAGAMLRRWPDDGRAPRTRDHRALPDELTHYPASGVQECPKCGPVTKCHGDAPGAPCPLGEVPSHLLEKVRAVRSYENAEADAAQLILDALAAAGVQGIRQPPLPRDLDPTVPRSSGVATDGVSGVDGGQQE